MTSESSETEFDKKVKTLKNRRWLAFVLLGFAIVVAVGQLTGAVEDIIGFMEKRVLTLPSSAVPEKPKETQPTRSLEQHREPVAIPPSAAIQSEANRPSPVVPPKAVEPTPPSVVKDKPVQSSTPEPASPESAPPEELQHASVASNPLEQVQELKDLVESISSRSKQMLEAYRGEGRRDKIFHHLEFFASEAGATNYEFRLLTDKSSGAAFRRHIKGIGAGDTSRLEVRIDDLSKRADEIDRIISSSSSATQGLWNEVKRDLGKLRAYF